MWPTPVDVLVITPPNWGKYQCSVSTSSPGYPPIDSVPLRLAAVAEQLGYETAVLPVAGMLIHFSGSDVPALRSLMAAYLPRCVIISTDYHIGDRGIGAFRAAAEIARQANDLWAGCPVMLCGKLPCIVRGQVLAESPHLAATYAGEPEHELEAVLRWLLSPSGTNPETDAVIYRRDGDTVDHGGFSYPRDLDVLPAPAYHLIKPHADNIVRLTHRATGVFDLSLRTSYGCPYSCRFCANTPHWHNVRFRSVDGIAADIDAAIRSLGDRALMRWFDDETFTLKPERVKGIADVMTTRGLRCAAVLTTTHGLDDELAATLARFSDAVMFGAENADPAVLRLAGKEFTGQHLDRAISTATAHNLKVRLEWMVGLPGETPSTALHNLNTVFNLLFSGRVDSINPYILTPDPGTEFARRPEEYGISLRTRELRYQGQNNNFPVYDLPELNAQQIFLYYLTFEMVTRQAGMLHSAYSAAGVAPPISNEADLELFSETLAHFS